VSDGSADTCEEAHNEAKHEHESEYHRKTRRGEFDNDGAGKATISRLI
jgi:hypothetical protein